MAKIAFILLCHKDPKAIIQQANQLTAVGDYISIHFDASAPKDAYQEILEGVKNNPNVTFAKKRIKCGWGEWSLVQATLNALEAALDAFPKASHFYMVSGDCMAIKSAEYAYDVLDRDDVDYVESFDFFDSDWIKTGFKEERLIYRYWFNEREQKGLFYKSFELQKKFKMTRKIPEDIQVQIGSQWWCLRRRTVEAIFDFLAHRNDVIQFFKTTWIPDETFFQTMVRHLVPGIEIRSQTLTFLMFSDYGMPATFYNDHYDMLLSQEHLFARKISPGATLLKERLGRLYASGKTDFSISNEGRNLYKFLTQKGRIGRRFAPRFWESESSIGRERELLIVVCKKWHVAKRFLDQLRPYFDFPVLEYIFNEDVKDLPDLGGILSSQNKKTRHRRALMKMLFEYYDTSRMVICVDPMNLALLDDFCSDRSKTRILEIECDFNDDYLVGHATRVGLIGDHTPVETIVRLLPSIRNDLRYESDILRDREFENHYRVVQNGVRIKNIEQIAGFADLEPSVAEAIIDQDWIYAD